MQVPVVGASKYTQQQQQIAAASVITREEIKAFGLAYDRSGLASLPASTPLRRNTSISVRALVCR